MLKLRNSAKLLATLVILAVLGAVTLLAGAQDFTIHNKTGVEIHALHISPHDGEEWGDDILGQDTLGSGESLNIKFSRKEKAALWDLRIEDSKGNSIEWENLNLLEISDVILHYAKGKAWATYE